MTYAEQDAAAIARAIYQRVGLTIEPIPIRVRNVERGQHHAKTHTITLPLWLWSSSHNPRERPFLEHYVAHELAHELCGEHGHHTWFYCVLHWLSPDGWHLFEQQYKPRNWRRAYRFIYGRDP